MPESEDRLKAVTEMAGAFGHIEHLADRMYEAISALDEGAQILFLNAVEGRRANHFYADNAFGSIGCIRDTASNMKFFALGLKK